MSARVLAVLIVVIVVSCHDEERRFTTPAATSSLGPEAETDATHWTANAWGLSEGKRLFEWFNCSGCHAHGGGGMGPALMDAKWIYGDSVAAVHESISQGRPNGMPAFAGRIPDAQIWQLAAFVRSTAGLGNRAAAPGRSDAMFHRKPESMTPPADEDKR